MDYFGSITRTFKENADPVHAAPMKKYMRDKFDFLGIKAPVRQEITQRFLDRSSLPDASDINKIVTKCWNEPYREYQYFALDLAAQFTGLLGEDQIEFYEYLAVNKSWWDTVDPIACDLIGPHFQSYPDISAQYIDEWLESRNIWLQRSAILFQLKYKNQTDTQLLEKSIHACSGSEDMFLRKAIGWALREYSKTDPGYVKQFVGKNNLPSLSVKEALKIIG